MCGCADRVKGKAQQDANIDMTLKDADNRFRMLPKRALPVARRRKIESDGGFFSLPHHRYLIRLMIASQS